MATIDKVNQQPQPPVSVTITFTAEEAGALIDCFNSRVQEKSSLGQLGHELEDRGFIRNSSMRAPYGH